MLLSGQPDHARAVAGRLYGGLLDAPFRVLVAEPGDGRRRRSGRGGTGAGTRRKLEAAAAAAGESVLTVPDGGERLTVLAVDGGSVVAAAEEYGEA